MRRSHRPSSVIVLQLYCRSRTSILVAPAVSDLSCAGIIAAL
jgi:hypothetical protein